MRYTVVWTATALQQHAEVWVEHVDRAAVNRDVDSVDRELRDDPDEKGDDYFGDRYVLLPVIWALYSVVPADRLVRVLQIGRIGFDLPHE
jgi:hypothetical protein